MLERSTHHAASWTVGAQFDIFQNPVTGSQGAILIRGYSRTEEFE